MKKFILSLFILVISNVPSVLLVLTLSPRMTLAQGTVRILPERTDELLMNPLTSGTHPDKVFDIAVTIIILIRIIKL